MASEVLAVQVESAARAAGLAVVASEAGEKYSGGATTKFTLALAAEPAKTQLLEPVSYTHLDVYKRQTS